MPGADCIANAMAMREQSRCRSMREAPRNPRRPAGCEYARSGQSKGAAQPARHPPHRPWRTVLYPRYGQSADTSHRWPTFARADRVPSPIAAGSWLQGTLIGRKAPRRSRVPVPRTARYSGAGETAGGRPSDTDELIPEPRRRRWALMCRACRCREPDRRPAQLPEGRGAVRERASPPG